MIELRRVEFSYGGGFRLRDIDLRFSDGVTALIGPNGSGKTTLLKLAAGLYRPSGGEVLIDGMELWSLPRKLRTEARRKIVYVHESPVMLRGTVEENVAYGLKLRRLGEEEIRQRVLRGLRLLGIEDLAGRDASRLSTGQRQRVALARAVAINPRYLLLDEPTANLDSKGRRLFAELVHRLKAQGTLITIATHDRFLAMKLADRVMELEDGRIVGEGEPEEVLGKQEV